MQTKKEKILLQPWIVSRFQAHRRKVNSASAAIDVRTPAAQPHVAVKLKKTQRELERQRDIVRENGRLLQRLGQIMNTNRVDNFWRECRPNFLNREIIYKKTNKTKPTSAAGKSAHDSIREDTTKTTSSALAVSAKSSSAPRGSSGRCATCSGRPNKRNQIIPEQRVPWAPPRISWNVKLAASSGRVPKCCIYCC